MAVKQRSGFLTGNFPQSVMNSFNHELEDVGSAVGDDDCNIGHVETSGEGDY